MRREFSRLKLECDVICYWDLIIPDQTSKWMECKLCYNNLWLSVHGIVIQSTSLQVLIKLTQQKYKENRPPDPILICGHYKYIVC